MSDPFTLFVITLTRNPERPRDEALIRAPASGFERGMNAAVIARTGASV